jgi:hypothetical protein
MTDVSAPVSRRLREVVREEGPRGVWWRGLGVTVYRRLAVFVRDVAEVPLKLGSGTGDPEAYLGPDDIDDYLKLRPDQTVVEIERRLATGQHCIVFREGGAILSARWLSLEYAELPYLGLSFELPPHVAYFHDGYTAEAARGRGIGGRSWGPAFDQVLAGAGATVVLGTIWQHNPLGMRLKRKGPEYHPIGTIGCARLGPLRIPVRRIPPGYLGRASRFHPAD